MEMRAWQDLGVVETIYEDDQEEEDEEEEGDEPEAEDERSNSPSLLSSSSSSPTSSPTHLRFPCLSPSPPPSLSLRSVVHAWSRANGCRTDIVIRLDDQCFHLHRDPIVKHSGYLRRLLTESSDVAVILPSGLTADAFAAAVISCYGAGVALTPSTLPAVRAAAEWLDLAGGGGGGGGGGDLVARTEEYFFREVATDAARAVVALRSCAALLGGGAAAAAAAATLLARCVEALAGCGGAGDGDEDGDDEGGGGGWLEEVAALPPEEFLSVAEAMRARCAHDHDLLYRIVDHYLENNKGKVTEEEKSRMCYSINCTKLSHSLFMHLVQNPRLPLRFVVQAMLVEQLNTHRSFFHRTTAAAAAAAPSSAAAIDNDSGSGGVATTLGAILNRDAALRQSAQLRSSMQATSFRIDGLEREIAALRRCLRSAEDGQPGHGSASFRILPDDREDSEEAECSGVGWDRWAFGAKLLRGLKNFFKKPGSTAVPVGRSSFRGGGGGGGGGGGRCAGGGGVAVKEDKEKEEEEVERRPQKHRRNRSLV